MDVLMVIVLGAIGSLIAAIVWDYLMNRRTNPRRDAKVALLQNAQRTNADLVALIADIERHGQTTPLHRDRLEECRKEFSAMRPSLAVLNNATLVSLVDLWHADIQSTIQSINDEERAWYQVMNLGLPGPIPPGLTVMPARKRVGDLRTLHGRGEGVERLILTKRWWEHLFFWRS
jgi:hypothetical protein